MYSTSNNYIENRYKKKSYGQNVSEVYQKKMYINKAQNCNTKRTLITKKIRKIFTICVKL